MVHNGQGGYLSSAADAWATFDATSAFGPDFTSHGSGTGSFTQPHENIDGRLYPHGWREAGFTTIDPTANPVFLNAEMGLPASDSNTSAASGPTAHSGTGARARAKIASAWVGAALRPPFADGLAPKHAMPVSLRQVGRNGISFRMLPPVPPPTPTPKPTPALPTPPPAPTPKVLAICWGWGWVGVGCVCV